MRVEGWLVGERVEGYWTRGSRTSNHLPFFSTFAQHEQRKTRKLPITNEGKGVLKRAARYETATPCYRRAAGISNDENSINGVGWNLDCRRVEIVSAAYILRMGSENCGQLQGNIFENILCRNLGIVCACLHFLINRFLIRTFVFSYLRKILSCEARIRVRLWSS